jgi:DegV family protein with EDD domain
VAIRVFSDSGSDIRPDFAKQLGITVVPLSAHFGEAVYKDGVDLMPDEFYRLLVTSQVLPNTSQPSPGDFLTAYKQNSEPGDILFSIHLSSKLSGTYQSAVLAAKQLTDREVRVIDTRSASLGEAIPVIMAARWAKSEVRPEIIEQRVQYMIHNQVLYFVVDTLEYLHRHGRIGKAQTLMGSLLNIKPVLTLDDGVVSPVEKVRGQSRALTRAMQLLKENTPEAKSYIAGVVDANVPEIADELAAQLKEYFPSAELLRATLGPTIGIHAGPGTIGIMINAIPENVA